MYAADSSAEALVGRESDAALFAGLLAELWVGRGNSVLIEGEPGIGKTALLESELAQACASGLDVARAGCAESERRGRLRVLHLALGMPVARSGSAGPGGSRPAPWPGCAGSKRPRASS